MLFKFSPILICLTLVNIRSANVVVQITSEEIDYINSRGEFKPKRYYNYDKFSVKDTVRERRNDVFLDEKYDMYRACLRSTILEIRGRTTCNCKCSRGPGYICEKSNPKCEMASCQLGSTFRIDAGCVLCRCLENNIDCILMKLCVRKPTTARMIRDQEIMNTIIKISEKGDDVDVYEDNASKGGGDENKDDDGDKNGEVDEQTNDNHSDYDDEGDNEDDTYKEDAYKEWSTNVSASTDPTKIPEHKKDKPRYHIHPDGLYRMKCKKDLQIIHNLYPHYGKCQFCACINKDWICRVSDEDCPDIPPENDWCLDPDFKDEKLVYHHSCFDCSCFDKYMVCLPVFPPKAMEFMPQCNRASPIDPSHFMTKIPKFITG